MTLCPPTQAFLLLLVALLAGCATPDTEFAADLETSRLPRADSALRIDGLGPCTDNPDRTLYLDGSQPISVLVHGCYGSSGQFRALAQVLAFHGQQSACFTYDDRARLADSGAGLTRALAQLAERSQVPQITVIGHSQGALVARRAVAEPLKAPLQARPVPMRLVTVSGPGPGPQTTKGSPERTAGSSASATTLPNSKSSGTPRGTISARCRANCQSSSSTSPGISAR